MQNKAPQIVDGDHVLKLGKDEIIRRLLTCMAAEATRTGAEVPEMRRHLRGWSVSEEIWLRGPFRRDEAKQLCEAYGVL